MIIKNMLNYLKPDPHILQDNDPVKVQKNYLYWRIRIFYSIYFGYVLFYFTRKSFTFAMPSMITELHYTKSDLGILGTVLYVSYGISKFVSGVISDQSNPRYFMSIGLILTGVSNICFGFSSSLFLFAIFWGLNGWFQGWGWPPCARLLSHWYSKNERGTWWSFWSTSHNLGGFLIPILAGACAQLLGWRYALHIPGILSILAGLFIMNRLRDTPQSLGLPAIEVYRNDTSNENQDPNHIERELTTKEVLFTYVLSNKWIWMLAFASFFIYIVRMAVNDWTALYLVETAHYSTIKASTCVSFFEIGGLIGMLSAGFLSDKIYSGRREPMNIWFTVGMLAIVCAFWYFAGVNVVLDSSLLFLIGFFLFGPQMLIGLAAAELSHKKAAGTASGFAGWFAYFGAAVTGYPMGKLTELYGWNFMFGILVACSVISLILFVLTSFRKHKNLASKSGADLKVAG